MKKAVKQSANQIIKKDCILYYRVSRNKMSDLRQERDCLEYCQQQGYTVNQTFREKISGTLRNRPQMTECIEYAKANSIQFLICSELSRLGRTNETNDIIEYLTNENNICVITLKESIKTMKHNEKGEWVKDDDQIFLCGILTAINKKESDTIGYRIASGKRNAVLSKGSSTGGRFLAFGYESIKGKLVVNVKEALIIKLIFDKYANAGWGSIKISNFLNQNGYKTRTLTAMWQRSTINQILKNSIYTGKRLYDGEPLEYNKDLRIIDDLTFNIANKRMAEGKNSNFDFNKLKKYQYLFDKKIIKCGVCNKHYFGIHKINTYKCISGKFSKSCGNKSIKQDWIELKVQQYLAQHWTKLIYDSTTINNQTEALEIDLKLLKAEQQKQLTAKDRYTDAFAMGNITKTKYNAVIDTTNDLLIKIQDSIDKTEEKISANRVTQTTIVKGVMQLQDNGHYKYTSFNIDKLTLHKIIQSITVYSDKVIVLLNNGNTFTLTRQVNL